MPGFCLLQWVSAFFYCVSAVFWLCSASVPIPKKYHSTGTYLVEDKPGQQQELDRTYVALKKQARWSAFAAGSAVIATIIQALALLSC